MTTTVTQQVKRPPWDGVSRDRLKLLTDMVRNRALPLSVHDERYWFKIEALVSPTYLPYMTILVRQGGCTARLELSDIPFQKPMKELLGDVTFCELPMVLRMGLLESLIDDVAANTRFTAGSKPYIENVVWHTSREQKQESLRHNGRYSLPFSIAHCESGKRVMGRMHLDDDLSLSCLRTALNEFAVWRDDGQWIPISGRLTVGTVSLSLKELTLLELGDILLFSTTKRWRSAQCRLEFRPNIAVVGTLASKKFTVEEVMINKEKSVPVSDSRPDVDMLAVECEFSIGAKTLTVGELRSLQPGSVLELSAKIDNPVTIMVGGRAIGAGEIIQIEDTIGVRITEFASASIPSKSEETPASAADTDIDESLEPVAPEKESKNIAE
ncbi:MAG: YscQ/HrcQ family type III secretion apparatus protein [Chitinivibrionales bacterium]|nr:YscQ/HrcQ family type III secretion apparatus protein [Chitinivibrionales bacterium]MBD3356590.1 YscQ/HrcQ family type III secretion apparatus protein [Chitinivibrionales bacterium]